MSILPSGLYLAQWPLLLPEEKLDEKIDLPVSMLTSKTHKAQLTLYAGQRDSTIAKAFRLSSRIGAPTLLGASGLVTNENLRNYTMQMEAMVLLGECVAVTRQDPAEALAYWALRGLRRGRDMGWERL